ncbi:uncharacterized protein At5g01610-like [Cornus florida]|uniref:uncharacterized protein At5g01610-like n=1 Tax=Cornus florida TaxID=4283 RepID=UPI00289E51B2|nr:uncharacterized protein At5g01610-like [Cornus florida]
MDLSFRLRPVSSTVILCLFLFFLSAAGDNSLSAYQVLEQYDFPVGLLPKGATGYDLNSETGEFTAYLNGTCSFKLENSYELEYKSTIKGVISKDRLKKLKGVRVKVVLLWLDIGEVKRNGAEIEFSVGIVSASFPVSNFDECPQCGCGLDCEGNTLELNPFVSSS